QLARFREQEAVRNRELQIASEIQRSVQPISPPDGEHIQIGAYWQPAREVGGDAWGWVQTDDEHLSWFILDVAGKGLPAALAAVGLHTALSMALRAQLPPVEVLERVNEQMYDAYTRTDLMATAVVIQLNPQTGRLCVANAGHPPVLVRQAGYWQQLEATAPPIGVLTELMAETQTLQLNPKDLILCYSDGFSEVQMEEGLLGHDGLLRMIPAGARNVQALTRHLVAGSKSLGTASDDQTLITALYTHEVTEQNHMEEHTTFPATLEDVSRFTPRMEARMSSLPLEVRTSVTLAVHELLVNVVEHAYAGEEGNIHFNVMQSADTLKIIIQDHAPNAFDPASASSDVPDPLDLPEGGMGMFIIHQTFETVDYKRTEDGNLWTLEKRIGQL
ncbi:MAG: SpoIIE family protein phosphatase, partial [Chloroflexota bacterium]